MAVIDQLLLFLSTPQVRFCPFTQRVIVQFPEWTTELANHNLTVLLHGSLAPYIFPEQSTTEEQQQDLGTFHFAVPRDRPKQFLRFYIFISMGDNDPVTFHCKDGRKVTAQMNYLAMNSRYFAALARHRREQESSTLQCQSFSAEAVQLLIHYVYHRDAQPILDASNAIEYCYLADMFLEDQLLFQSANALVQELAADSLTKILQTGLRLNQEILLRSSVDYLLNKVSDPVAELPDWEGFVATALVQELDVLIERIRKEYLALRQDKSPTEIRHRQKLARKRWNAMFNVYDVPRGSWSRLALDTWLER